MSDLHITVKGQKRLLTAGKRHTHNIVITAEGEDHSYDAFWDAFQEYGSRVDYSAAFYNIGWTDASYNPKYDIIATESANNLFAYSRITDTKKTINIANAKKSHGIFEACYLLKTIRKIVVSEELALTNFVYDCIRLENITVEGTIGQSIAFAQSSLLTTASVNSIINALKDLAGATAQTLTFHADVGGKLTDAQKATITAKNWTLVY